MVKVNKEPVSKARTMTTENWQKVAKGLVITLGSMFIGGFLAAILGYFQVQNIEELMVLLGTALGNVVINLIREYTRSDR